MSPTTVTPAEGVGLRYVPGLDGIRALAVLLVISRHWRLPPFHTEFGWIGVNVFFVLSGYLICSILLVDKPRYDRRTYVTNFYAKRALRIFPVYFLFLALLFVFIELYDRGTPSARYEELDQASEAVDGQRLALTFYFFNFRDLIAELSDETVTGSKMISHLWSLSVEEQFYILFPFVVLLLTRRQLVRVLAVVLVLAPLIRLAIGWTGTSRGWPDLAGLLIYKTTFTQIDALALGGLIAAVGVERIRISNRSLALIGGAVVVMLVGTVVLARIGGAGLSYTTLGMELPVDQVGYDTGNPLVDFKYVYGLTLVNIGAAVVILAAVRGVASLRWFEHPTLVWVGKRSYGIYVFHHPIMVVFLLVAGEWIDGVDDENRLFVTLPLFTAYLAVVMVVAWFSYRFFESVFLAWKDRIKARETPA